MKIKNTYDIILKDGVIMTRKRQEWDDEDYEVCTLNTLLESWKKELLTPQAEGDGKNLIANISLETKPHHKPKDLKAHLDSHQGGLPDYIRANITNLHFFNQC